MTKINRSDLKKEVEKFREFGLTIAEISKLLRISKTQIMTLLYKRD